MAARRYQLCPPSTLNVTVSHANAATITLKPAPQRWCERPDCGQYTLVSGPPPLRTCLLCVLTGYDAYVEEQWKTAARYLDHIQELTRRLEEKERKIEELTNALNVKTKIDVEEFLRTLTAFATNIVSFVPEETNEDTHDSNPTS